MEHNKKTGLGKSYFRIVEYKDYFVIQRQYVNYLYPTLFHFFGMFKPKEEKIWRTVDVDGIHLCVPRIGIYTKDAKYNDLQEAETAIEKFIFNSNPIIHNL